LKGLSASGDDISAVITQPDRPAGRGHNLQAPPVKQAALELNLRVEQPSSLNDEPAHTLFESLQPEVMVVVAYGKIIPRWLIAMPRYGVVNLHGSLLPRYRGAAPIQWAVANGDTETGVCTMQIDEGLDTGPVYLCETVSIDPGESVQQLSDRLAQVGSGLVQRTLSGLINGTLSPTPQDHTRATHAPMLKKQDGYIDWRLPARTIHNRIRAFQPWPGAVTQFRDEVCKILKSRPGVAASPASSGVPGTIVASPSGKGSFAVLCGDGMPLDLLELQLPGRKPWPAPAFWNNVSVAAGEKFHSVTDN
jgi:methionyl-tRNA formyltransferase